MGDHRLYIHDFCARSVLGVEYPKLVRAGSRKLHCKVERTVKSYNRVLKQLLIRHRASDKMFSLGKNHEDMSVSEFHVGRTSGLFIMALSEEAVFSYSEALVQCSFGNTQVVRY